MSCKSSKDENILTGDLYFGSYVRRLSYPGREEDGLADTINKTDFGDTSAVYNLLDKTKSLISTYRGRHFVNVLVSKDSIVRLLLDSVDYLEVSPYEYERLRNDKKKINLKAKILKIENGFYECTDLIKVEVVDGETLADKD
jgi:hypothetical protein